jgi:hypothetical protein
MSQYRYQSMAAGLATAGDGRGSLQRHDGGGVMEGEIVVVQSSAQE